MVCPCLFPGSARTLDPNLPGVGLGAYRAVFTLLFNNFGPPNEGRPCGVEVTFCAFRRGDSGLGSEGRDLGRNAGLGARPGPID